jgi:hypothetical protein
MTNWTARRGIVALAAALSIAGSSGCREIHDLHAQHRQKDEIHAVAGKWSMSFAGHDGFVATLVLEQDGRKVTGTFTSPHGDTNPVRGELENGTLTISVTGEGDHAGMTFEGSFKDKDTLTGKLNGPMGEMSWTAKRSTDRKD